MNAISISTYICCIKIFYPYSVPVTTNNLGKERAYFTLLPGHNKVKEESQSKHLEADIIEGYCLLVYS